MKQKFNQLFQENYSALCNYATSYVQDTQEAEDIVQSVFIKFWESQKINELDNPVPYLIKSVKHKCIDYLRARKKNKIISTEHFPEIGVNAAIGFSEEDILPLLHFFAAKLPPKTRRVFLLSRQDGLSYKEIAQKIDVSTKTVENQISFALKKMKTFLKIYEHLFSFLYFSSFIFFS